MFAKLCMRSCALIIAVWAGVMLHDTARAAEPTFSRTIQPFLKQYCWECHDSETQEADIILDRFDESAAIAEQAELWEKVTNMLNERIMPPEDMPQPAPEEIAEVTGWLQEQLLHAGCGGTPDPGRVTLRRLNRAEYNNTVRDLLGVDFRPADDFPSDDVGYGFDNIGDVLTLSPLLMEKYLQAAEEIARRAVQVPEEHNAQWQDFRAKELEASNGTQAVQSRGFRVLASEGELRANWKVPTSGRYRLLITAYGEKAGGADARMAVRVDRDEILHVDVAADADQPAAYLAEVDVAEGRHEVGIAFTNDYYDPEQAERGNHDRNLCVGKLRILGPLPSTDELPEGHRRMLHEAKSFPTAEDWARAAVARFGTRAFRRPLTEHEIERLVKLVLLADRQGESLEAGMRLAVTAALISPHFLFRVEEDPTPNRRDVIRELDEFELATRLSYFLWSSMPDEELFRLAGAGQLRANLDKQVRRMIADPKSQALVENFASQWLTLRNLAEFEPDPEMFPGFDDALRQDMLRETELFFVTVMREDRSILEFLDADYTFLNARLARHYGLPEPEQEGFTKVPLAGTDRGGVLTHGSILALTSNPTRTSPVKRGKWVLDQILGTPPPPPPPGVEELSEESQDVLSGSLRQRMEQHRENPTCASCHQRMDPLGFAMENFNAVGAWRDFDGAFEIDASGELPDGTTFVGAPGLRDILRDKADQFRRAFVGKLLTYALGRGLESADRCTVLEICRETEEEGDRFSSVVVGIVHSDAFQKRRGIEAPAP